MQEVKFHPVSKLPFQLDIKPVRASNLVPQWYQDQDFGSGNLLTIKRCMPMLDAMTAGYIFVVPTDIHINATHPELLDFWLDDDMRRYSGDILSRHSHSQYSHYPIDLEKYHAGILRVNPLWAIETPEGYSTLFIDPIHRQPSPIHALSGVIDTDSYASEGYLSFLVDKGFNGVIKQGTPLIQLIPFKREDWDSKWSNVILDNRKQLDEQHTRLKHSNIEHAYRKVFRKLKRW